MEKIPENDENLHAWMPAYSADALYLAYSVSTVGELGKAWIRIKFDCGIEETEKISKTVLQWATVVMAAFYSQNKIKVIDPDSFTPIGECLPTGHPPGSSGKIEVLRERLENGQPLYHELDNPHW